MSRYHGLHSTKANRSLLQILEEGKAFELGSSTLSLPLSLLC